MDIDDGLSSCSQESDLTLESDSNNQSSGEESESERKPYKKCHFSRGRKSKKDCVNESGEEDPVVALVPLAKAVGGDSGKMPAKTGGKSKPKTAKISKAGGEKTDGKKAAKGKTPKAKIHKTKVAKKAAVKSKPAGKNKGKTAAGKKEATLSTRKLAKFVYRDLSKLLSERSKQ